jgi:hypothetical protein
MDVITLTGEFNNKNSLCILVLESGARARLTLKGNDTSILILGRNYFRKQKEQSSWLSAKIKVM